MARKSNICFSKRDGKPLSVYDSEYEANESAAYLRSLGRDFVPYLCNTCGKWHLAPGERRTPSKTCSCVDSGGKQKELYETEEAALKRAEIIEEERGITLKVYPCPVQDGWHLTKNLSGF